MFPHDDFADVVAANNGFAERFAGSQLTGVAKRGLAVVTCMDSRITPLALLGMEIGDVKILRNAGARVTDDVLRTLVLGAYLLGVRRVLVMPHTDCRMALQDEATIHAEIEREHGVDTRSLEFRTVDDQRGALAADVASIRAFEFLPRDLIEGGAIYDVQTGLLELVDC